MLWVYLITDLKLKRVVAVASFETPVIGENRNNNESQTSKFDAAYARIGLGQIDHVQSSKTKKFKTTHAVPTYSSTCHSKLTSCIS